MNPVIWLILGVTISLAVSGFMILAGIGDVPEDRSSHSAVTPTSGGLGIVAALGVCAFVLAQTDVLTVQMAQVLSLIWAVGFLGFTDDIYNLAAGFKFGFLAIIAAVAVWVVGPVTELPFGQMNYELPLGAGYAGSFLWIFVVLNIVNFLDGSNGLMLIVMGIATATLSLIAFSFNATQPAILLCMLLAGMIGLAPYNIRPQARIFSGDVGALTVGFSYALAVLWLCQTAPGANPVYLGPVLILVFLADGLFTIIRRIIAREKLMQAHKTHLYQRMIQHGFGHMKVAFLYGFLTAGLAVFAVYAVGDGLHRFASFLILPLVLFSSAYLLLGRRFS